MAFSLLPFPAFSFFSFRKAGIALTVAAALRVIPSIGKLFHNERFLLQCVPNCCKKKPTKTNPGILSPVLPSSCIHSRHLSGWTSLNSTHNTGLVKQITSKKASLAKSITSGTLDSRDGNLIFLVQAVALL